MKPLERAVRFCDQVGITVPIFLAPMAGACPPSLSIAVANSGGMGACGALLMQPEEIIEWADAFRAESKGAFQINLWIPGAPPSRNFDAENRLRGFLAQWGPAPGPEAALLTPPDAVAQQAAILRASPPAVSSIMGLYPTNFVAELKCHRIKWFATVSTVHEAKLAEAAGADAIIAQGMEAGGHRGSFDDRYSEQALVGLVSLVPAVADSVSLPVIAAGGVSDSRGVAAALSLGASAVQIGTGFLRSPEAGLPPAWSRAISNTMPEDTVLSRVFSGRAGRSISTGYVRAATDASAPPPAPYPVQRGLTSAMRAQATKMGDIERMQAWAGQSAMLAPALPAAEIVTQFWNEALDILG